MSAHVYWSIIRNNHAFLMKRSGYELTKEPNNLKGQNSFRFNGLVHRKAISIEPAKDQKGVVFSIKREKEPHKPSKNMHVTTLKKDGRRTMTSINNILKNHRYGHSLTKVSYRRASAIMRGQKAKPVVQRRKKKKE